MKTKKLIELLQKEDPTGDSEVCVNNSDIFCLEGKPAYWDGCLEILHRNWDCEYYNVTGATVTSEGSKIDIRAMSIEDAVFGDTEMPVTFATDYAKQHYADFVAKCRQESRDCKRELGAEMIVQVLKKYQEGWKAAQAIAEPLIRCNVQWWWREGDTGTKRLYATDKGHNKQISLCQGHCQAVTKSKFFRPVNDGQRIIWEFCLDKVAPENNFTQL